jgi:hypothetical protein
MVATLIKKNPKSQLDQLVQVVQKSGDALLRQKPDRDMKDYVK